MFKQKNSKNKWLLLLGIWNILKLQIFIIATDIGNLKHIECNFLLKNVEKKTQKMGHYCYWEFENIWKCQ